MTEKTRLQFFLELSAVLTGVEVSSFDRPRQAAKSGDLEPRNSPVQMGPVYLKVLEGWNEGRGLALVLQEFERVQGAYDGVRAMLEDKELGPICRSITKLWMLGVWYPPNQQTASHVISVDAYVQSLAPKVMQAHPMGYSMQYYGHWSEKPPPLPEFITLKK